MFGEFYVYDQPITDVLNDYIIFSLEHTFDNKTVTKRFVNEANGVVQQLLYVISSYLPIRAS